jgi:Tfp pilus assembly protein PilO
MPAITLQSFKSYVPLLPWFVLAIILGSAWAGVHLLMVAPAGAYLSRVEADRSAMRQKITARQDARETAKDMSYVLRLLPTQRDFAELPLAISEEAIHKGVALPSVSYAFEKPDDAMASKAIFRGPVTGRYEDLRRFIYGVETSNQLVFIEDLEVSRSGKSEREAQNREIVTFNLKMSTYVRKNAALASNTGPTSESVPHGNAPKDKAPGKEVNAQ